MNLLTQLQQDHREVKERCASFHQLLISMGKEQREEFLRQMEYFGKELKDHLQLEEDELFPRLQPLLPPQGPVQAMILEHEKLRALHQQLATLIWEENPDYDEIGRLGDEFTGLLLNHILKEDRVLFPMAQSLLHFAETS